MLDFYTTLHIINNTLGCMNFSFEDFDLQETETVIIALIFHLATLWKNTVETFDPPYIVPYGANVG